MNGETKLNFDQEFCFDSSHLFYHISLSRMPPKSTNKVGSAATTAVVVTTANIDSQDEDEVDSRPQTPTNAMDFSNYEFSGVFLEDIGQHDTLDNERKSQVYTAIGYTCTGSKVVIQAWAPYDKDVYNFMK